MFTGGKREKESRVRQIEGRKKKKTRCTGGSPNLSVHRREGERNLLPTSLRGGKKTVGGAVFFPQPERKGGPLFSKRTGEGASLRLLREMGEERVGPAFSRKGKKENGTIYFGGLNEG